MKKIVFIVTKKGGIVKQFKTMNQAKKQLRVFGWQGSEIKQITKWIERPTLLFFEVTEWNTKEVGVHVSAGRYDEGETMYKEVATTPKTWKTYKIQPFIKNGELVSTMNDNEVKLQFIEETSVKPNGINFTELKNDLDLNDSFNRTNHILQYIELAN
tara:strand:+ start:65 stop:535 length:471 start_codon:yes stop_codon:yes gene_type:complete